LFTAEAEPSGDYGKAEWAEHKLSMQREWERRRLSKAMGLLPSQKHISAVLSAEAVPQSINDGSWAAAVLDGPNNYKGTKPKWSSFLKNLPVKGFGGKSLSVWGPLPS
jgi:hypothetical protein